MSEKKENSIAISQDELDKVLSGLSVMSTKKVISKETQDKIDLLKTKTKKVEKKLNTHNSAKNKEEKINVYYNNKLYGTGKIVVKNGKKRFELISIKD